MKYFIYRKIYWFTFKIRNLYWTFFIKKIGKGCKVFGKITVYSPENLEIGINTTLNEGVFINARTKIKIGSNVHISPYCIINSAGLDYSNTMEKRTHVSGPVIIGNGVWLGSGSIINPGVEIGDNSVIGAGAVVTRNIPSGCVAVGVPAKVIKNINE